MSLFNQTKKIKMLKIYYKHYYTGYFFVLLFSIFFNIYQCFLGNVIYCDSFISSTAVFEPFPTYSVETFETSLQESTSLTHQNNFHILTTSSFPCGVQELEYEKVLSNNREEFIQRSMNYGSSSANCFITCYKYENICRRKLY
jgi:hypothetical protein